MSLSGEAYIPRAVCEALDSIVSPDLRDRLLYTALEVGALQELPINPAAFREFLEGPLADTLLRELGEELGLSVVTELGSIVDKAERDALARTGRTPIPQRQTMPSPRDGEQVNDTLHPAYRSTSPIPRPYSHDTLPDELSPRSVRPGRRPASTDPSPRMFSAIEHAPPASSNYPRGMAHALGVAGADYADYAGTPRLPLVLVASQNQDCVRGFSAWLDPRASVNMVRGLGNLIQAVTKSSERRIVIVFDASAPSVRPLALAAIADELPESARVLLWGIDAGVYAQMLGVSSSVATWIVCGGDVTTREVAAQCARIVG